MRKKSPATIQRWVNSIGTDTILDDGDNLIEIEKDSVKENCDIEDRNKSDKTSSSDNTASTSKNNNEPLGNKDKGVNITTTTTTTSKSASINEFCKKINMHKKLKEKRFDFNKIIERTAQKLKNSTLSKDTSSIQLPSSETSIMIQKEILELPNEEENIEKVESVIKTIGPSPKRPTLGSIGRSSSENQQKIPTRMKLNKIGRSFSVSYDNDISNELINEKPQYDEDNSKNSCITIPSVNTSSSINSNISEAISSNSQLNESIIVPEQQSCSTNSSTKVRKSREHSLSESNQGTRKSVLIRDSSFQSDSSHCSSVESLLEARKPDAETVLMNLGFGPSQPDDVLSKIPKRFLAPSKLKGIDTEEFMKKQQLAINVHGNSVLGYRGLLGNPHIPPSSIVKTIMERFSKNELNRMESSESLDCFDRSPRNFRTVANTVLAHRCFMK